MLSIFSSSASFSISSTSTTSWPWPLWDLVRQVWQIACQAFGSFTVQTHFFPMFLTEIRFAFLFSFSVFYLLSSDTGQNVFILWKCSHFIHNPVLFPALWTLHGVSLNEFGEASFTQGVRTRHDARHMFPWLLKILHTNLGMPESPPDCLPFFSINLFCGLCNRYHRSVESFWTPWQSAIGL